MIILRLLAECASIDAAAALNHALALQLADLHPSLPQLPEPYWKLPGSFELTFQFAVPALASVAALLDLASSGWTHYGDDTEQSSVWNRRDGSVLLQPEIFWAELIQTMAGAWGGRTNV